MRFTPGPILDPDAQKQRDDAIEASEQSRAKRETQNTPKGANTPPGWKAWKRPTTDEVDREILSKTKKGKI